MTEWSGKSKGTVLGYRIFVAFCKVGRRPAYLLLRIISFYYFLFAWPQRNSIYRYFRAGHKFSRTKSLISTIQNFYIFGQTLVDKHSVIGNLFSDLNFKFFGDENLSKILEMGKGGILLSAHIGNWEVAAHHLFYLNAKANIVVYDGENEEIKYYLNKISGNKLFNFIIMRKDMSHVFEIGYALSQNEFVCLHADRFLPDSQVIKLSFLGEEAKFPIGPFLLATTFGVPTVVTMAVKEKPDLYHYFCSDIVIRGINEKREIFINRLSTKYVQEVEKMVKKYPTQWFNYYNFWKK